MYKEREESQFHVAPCWDFDLAFDNDQRNYPVNGRSNWAYNGGSAAGNMKSFVTRLLGDNAAYQQLNQIWKDNRKEGLLDEETLVDWVDSMAQDIEASANLNFIRWPILNSRVHQNVSALGSFQAEVDVLRNYIPARLAWIDNYLGYDPGAMYTDSTYYISTPEELIEFATIVQGGAQYSNAYLEADLDMEGYNSQFKPIGTNGKAFRGVFDGQGHRIKNLHISGSGDFTGLFGAVGGGATISNLILDSSCSISGGNYVGLAGGSTGAGNVSFSCVGNEANVTATGANAAGIIGCNKGSTCTFSITNCYNTGDITGASESAAICGWLGTNATLHNCFNIGTVTGYNYRNDFYRGGASAVNCYSTSTTQVNRITSDDVASGKLCYQLNGGTTMDPIWFQTLGQDAHPVFDVTHNVVLRTDDGTYYNISHIAGDVNGNNILDETDAQWIASYLTGETPEGFQEINADANMDSHINVADFVTVRRILNEVPLGQEALTATLYSSNTSVKAGGTRKVTVWVKMSRAATAYEADIVLSDGLSIQEGSIAFNQNINSDAHIVKAFPKANGAHIIVFAPDNEAFSKLTGTALTFTLAGADDFTGGTYQIQKQCFICADGVECLPDDVTYDITLAKTYVSSLIIEPSAVEMVAGDDTMLLVTILPATATVKELNWMSSDESVATVQDGIVTAVTAGSATVTAQATDGSNVKATALVFVYNDATGVASPLGETEDGDIYTLSGTRLDRITETGIYIIGGKKRLVKVK